MINKKQIPYILRVLCRWIPGLKLDENGSTPVPPPHKGLRLGDEVYTIYFNTSQTPDLAGLDWTKDTHEISFMKVATAKVKALFALDQYGAESSEVEKHSVVMAMFVPKGWTVPSGPSAGTVVNIDTYFISGEFDSSDSIEEILSQGGGDMIYADPEFLKLVGGTEGFQENGWCGEDELYSLSIMFIEAMAQSKRVEVSLIPEPAKSNEIVDRLPFERTEITPETDGEVLFYDPDIVPDFNKLTCWKEMKEEDVLGAFLAILFGEDTDYVGSHGISVLKYPKGMEADEGYVVKEDAIALMVDRTPIYVNNGYCIIMKDLEGEDIEPGWATFPDDYYRGNVFKSFNLVLWQRGGSGSVEDIVVNDFDIWGKWLSVEPFYYPEVVVPKAAPPEPGTLTKFVSGQTIHLYDKIVFDLTRSDEMRRFLENDVQYDSYGGAEALLSGSEGSLLQAWDLNGYTHGGISSGKVLALGYPRTDAVVYSTVTADYDQLNVKEGFNTDILTDGAIEFNISRDVTLDAITLGNKWNGILAGYQPGTEPPTPVITPGFTVRDQFNSNSAALYLNPNKADEWYDLMTNWTYEACEYDRDILRAYDINGSGKEFRLRVHSEGGVDAALYLYQYGDCQGTETLLYTPKSMKSGPEEGFQPIVTENNGYIFLNADNIDFQVRNLYYEDEGWNNIDLITYMTSEKPFIPTESFILNQTPEHIYVDTGSNAHSYLANLSQTDYNNGTYEYLDSCGTRSVNLLKIGYETEYSYPEQYDQFKLVAIRFDHNNEDAYYDDYGPSVVDDDTYRLAYYYNINGVLEKDEPGDNAWSTAYRTFIYDSNDGWLIGSSDLDSILSNILEYNSSRGSDTFVQKVSQQSGWKDIINQDPRIIE